MHQRSKYNDLKTVPYLNLVEVCGGWSQGVELCGVYLTGCNGCYFNRAHVELAWVGTINDDESFGL